MVLVLQQMSIQLNKHFANLSCALSRSEKMYMLDVKVNDTVQCLQSTINSMEKEIDQFRKEVYI